MKLNIRIKIDTNVDMTINLRTRQYSDQGDASKSVHVPRGMQL